MTKMDAWFLSPFSFTKTTDEIVLLLAGPIRLCR